MSVTSRFYRIPNRDSVSIANQLLFDKLHASLGFVPNLYATFAHSETALGDYLRLQSRPSSLSAKEKEIINLVVSQVNQCRYCLAAHTLLAQKAGFTEDQTTEIRRGMLSTDTKLDALARFVKIVAETRGQVNPQDRVVLFDAGYTEANLVDIVMLIGDKTITNYLHNLTEFPVDFPEASAI